MTTTKPYFPILESEMAKHGITSSDIAARIGITERSFRNKLTGNTDFWWNEVLEILTIFPTVEPTTLFSHTPDTISIMTDTVRSNTTEGS